MEKRSSGWKRELLGAHERIAGLFARSEARERSLAYLQGLLSHCERKNGWQLAEWMGESVPYRVQHLLDRARWDADAGRVRPDIPLCSNNPIVLTRIAHWRIKKQFRSNAKT